MLSLTRTATHKAGSAPPTSAPSAALAVGNCCCTPAFLLVRVLREPVHYVASLAARIASALIGPVNRITTGSLKEQKNETVQKYKPKVPNKKKCHGQVKLNVSRVLLGCWWGCSGVFAFV